MKKRLKRVYELIERVRGEMPLDLIERHDDFGLDNGGVAIQLYENGCTYEIARDFEIINAEYENLTKDDLDEIIRILESIEKERYDW